MCVTPSSTAVRRTAIAWSRSLGGPKTPGPASCIAPYPILVMVRSSARVMVEFVMSPLFVADGRTGSAPLFLVLTGPSLPGHARSTVVVMESTNALGDYLRARREQVRPEDVGIRSIGLRRVPGLRREEVAMLAGISSDYYLRLEQGRDRNPSVQGPGGACRRTPAGRGRDGVSGRSGPGAAARDLEAAATSRRG